MTRSSHHGNLNIDLKIERSVHRLKRKVRQNQEQVGVLLPSINIALDLVSSNLATDYEVKDMVANNMTLKEITTLNLN